MALETNELYVTPVTQGDQLRLYPAEGGIRPKTFAEVAEGAAYPHGTPVAQDTTTGLWVAYTEGGTNGTGVIAGFVFEPLDGARANDTGDGEVINNVLILGIVHRDDVNTAEILAALPAATTEAELDDALRAQTLRELGITVEGLAGAA